MSRPRRSPRHGPARYAAPAALLLAVTVAVLLVRAGLHGGKGSTTTTGGPTTTAHVTSATQTRPGKRPAARFYIVAAGDTFGSIAAKTGITVARLEQLNPGVSSNSLQVGQRLRVK
jgi:LysM repeat protein